MTELLSSEKVKYGDSVMNAMRFIDEEGYPYGVKHTSNRPHVTPYVWDTVSLSYVAQTQTSITTGSLTVSGAMTITKTALTAAAPTAVSVGVTSAQAVASNVNRKGLMLVNTSANYISIGIGSAAVLYSGITLNPGGGAFWMDEFCFSTGAVNAIASGATSNLGVTEFT